MKQILFQNWFTVFLMKTHAALVSIRDSLKKLINRDKQHKKNELHMLKSPKEVVTDNFFHIVM